MKPIIKWTFWQRRWSLLWWSIGVFGLIFINMVFYPTFKDQAAELQKSFDSLPEAAVQLFGGSTDFFSPVGFLNSQIFFLMLPLLLGIFAIGLGNSLIGKEEQDHTIETILAKPVSRKSLFIAKGIVGLGCLSFITLVGLLTTLITAKVVEIEVSLLNISIATLACFLLVLSFGSVSFVLAATGKARGASISIATLVALGGYLISSLSGTVSWLKGPSRLLPFNYYQPEPILRGNTNWWNLLILLSVSIVLISIAWLSFRARDIK